MTITGREITEALLKTEGTILVACHRTPDGDTLGAGLGLFLWLRHKGRAVRVYCADPVPAVYRFLPGAGEVSAEWPEGISTLVCADCASVDRVNDQALELMQQVPLVINIDHHATNPNFGSLNLVVSDAGSTAEVVAEMLFDAGQDVPRDVADCLYTGVVTDTGQFSFDYTRPESLRAAARLMEHGADFEGISARIFRRRSLSKTRIIASTLSSLKLFGEGKVALLTVSQADLKQAAATPDECENVVNYAVEIDGVEVGILLRETQTGDWKGSLRASGRVDVARIALMFGGGGHVKAAGCTLKMPIDEADKAIVDAALAALAAK